MSSLKEGMHVRKSRAFVQSPVFEAHPRDEEHLINIKKREGSV